MAGSLLMTRQGAGEKSRRFFQFDSDGCNHECTFLKLVRELQKYSVKSAELSQIQAVTVVAAGPRACTGP